MSHLHSQYPPRHHSIHLYFSPRLVEDGERDSADCWVINTCTVKSPSQSSMSNLIMAGRALGKKLVISGCVPQGDKWLEELQDLSLLGGQCSRGY